MMRKVRNTKAKGATWERVVRHKLEDDGWFVVRQASSAFPDLIAINASPQGTIVMFVECKVGKYISMSERTSLEFYNRRFHVITAVAYPKYSSASKKKGNVVIEPLVFPQETKVRG